MAASTTVQSYNSTIDTIIAGAGSSQFWRGDSTWAIPSGGVPTFDLVGAGGDNSGGVDASATLTTLLATMPATGGKIITHGGTWKFCSLGTTVTINKPVEFDFEGAVVNLPCVTGLAFYINTTGAARTVIENAHFTAPTTHTANYYFVSTSLNVIFSNIEFDHHYRFIDIEDSQNFFAEKMYGHDSYVGSGSGDFMIGCGGAGTGNGVVTLRDIYSTNADMAHQSSFGVQACNGDGYTFENVFEVLHGNDFMMTPQTGNTLANVHFINSTPDTSTNGIVVQPSGTGVATDITIDDTWASVQTGDGILLDATHGTISNVTITGGNRILSNGGAGVHTIGAVQNLQVLQGNVSANGTGLNISSATTGYAGMDLNVTGNTTNITNASSGFTVRTYGGGGGGGGGTSCDNMTMKGGIIGSIGAGATAAVTFATAFPHALCTCGATMIGGPTVSPIPASVTAYSTTGCTFNNASSIGPLAAMWTAGGW